MSDAKTKVVPVEPTEEMGEAAWATMSDEFYSVGIHLNMMAAIRAAIAASPTPAERVVDPVAKGPPGYPSKVVMPNGDVLHRPLGESSWGIETAEKGFCVSGEQDWELVERYGLDALYAAALSATPQPATSDVPHDVVRAPDAWIEREGLEALRRDKTSKTQVASGLLKRPFGDKVPLYNTPVPSNWTEEALRAENARLIEAAQAVLDAETVTVHVGYDNAAGGGNFVYADAIRTDDEAFTKLRTALSR